jgi:DNA-binding transcriptional regulator YbjK
MSQDIPKRRHDPERRQRIIEAALQSIALHGVAGTSHRRIAELADVPLGSMTYHFSGMDEVLVAAFSAFTSGVAARYIEVLDAAASLEQAREAVVDIICGEVWVTPASLLLTHELYAYASRNADVRQVQQAWMACSRQALQRHFDARTARALDAFIEGAIIHNAASSDLLSRAEVRRIVGLLSA